MNFFALVFASLTLLFLNSCSDEPQTNNTAKVVSNDTVEPGYDFSKAEVVKLKKKLREISGIVHLGGDSMAAIQDESGVIFILSENTGEILNQIVFADNGDYEDIAVDEQNFYVLESSGIIYKVARDKGSAAEYFELNKKKRREFESLFFLDNKLLMLCKSCKNDDKEKEAFCFNVQTMQFDSEPCFKLDLASVIKFAPKGFLFKPSAAAMNPADKKLYVLASVGKMLLQCNTDGVVERSFPLDGKLFVQPEGICFKPDGTMLISNEAAGGDATIVKISLKN